MFNQEVILTPKECKSIIDMNTGFTQSKVVRNEKEYVSEIRTSSESKVDTSEEVKSMLLPKLSKYGISDLPETFNLLKDEVGQQFKKQKDVGAHIHTIKRYKTLIIQLSENYKGGELIVWDGDDEIICDTTAGNMILFPSELFHQAKVITDGIRYVMVFFLERKHLGITKTLM